ncbi:hemagglutinin repeat-containing protein [Fulvimonas soli]|uniref:hemagglutinin repeat-containing protein n=1 Tax=Fulvimonas soli TaxID=155197 RepID=UPI00112198F3|nr:hemagglutinin repeat-containing protein [Fulvimonas soli]
MEGYAVNVAADAQAATNVAARGSYNVALAAAHDLNIESQAEHHTLKSDNRNASGGVGLQIGTDGIGFYAEASVGKGNAHGNGATHVESHIDASDTLSLIAGNDATLKGAQLTGHTILANVGHDLNVVSEQDTDDYASQQWQAGGKVVIGYGSGASASYSQSKADSHYASVNEVTGLQAGAGGYQIHVGDSTHLVGGQLASTADPGQNVLDTGNLIAQRLHNESKYGASSVGVSGGYGAGSGFSGGLSLGVPQHGNTNSDTVSGVAAGTVIVRDGSGEGDLNRNQVTLDGNGIRNGFDAQKVQENQEVGQIAGQVGMRAAGDIEQAMGWAPGSTGSTILHGLVGAAASALGGGNIAQGATGAAASEAAVSAMQNYLWSQGINPDSATGKILMQLGSAAIGGAAGGGAGTAMALQGEQFNRQLHQDADPAKNEKAIIDNVLAKQYAAENPDMSVELAAQVLEGAAMVMLDQATAANSVYDPARMQEAQNFLRSYAQSQGNPIIGYDQFGQPVPLFGVSAPYQRNDATIFGSNPQTAQGPQELGWSQVGDWAKGFGQGAIGAFNPSNVATGLQSTVNMLTDPKGWMSQAQQGMEGVLYLAQQGNFGPAGQMEGAMAGNATLSAALSYGMLRWGSASNSGWDVQLTNPQERQWSMLDAGKGFNVSPVSWDSYATIGRNGTYVTDQKAITDVIGSFYLSGEMVITKSQADALEVAMGLERGSLSNGFKIRQVDGIFNMSPRSPLEGNQYFQGPGRHLPGGGPEMVIDPISTTDNANVRTITTVKVKP